LLLSRSDVAALLTFADCVEAVEAAFAESGAGRAPASDVASVHVAGGAFHVKAGGLGSLFAAKVNGNFPGNRERRGLPTVQGLLVLADAENGRPLAVMDSIEITIRRTGAATAVAARRLARPGSRSGLVVGCGVQGAIQAEALAHALPLETLRMFDIDERRASDLAAELTGRLGIAVEPVAAGGLRDALRGADACVTCTTARSPILHPGDLRPGAFVAAVGADNPDKQELAAELVAHARVVVDEIDACAESGELHHAIEAGLMTRDDVAADLGSLVAGRTPLASIRRAADEIVVFDSTGIAIEDVAAAGIVYRRALESGRGTAWTPAEPASMSSAEGAPGAPGFGPHTGRA
jgi:ornithine cyclodeaminase/alanine dehydrogenase-like protein (mu-crystallin family)